MKIIDKAKTPDGVEIQLEDWSQCNTDEYPDLYGFQIGAYPKAQRGSGFVNGGDSFRLTISQNKYAGYTNQMVIDDYAKLKSGEKTFSDLQKHFWNGIRDAYILGL